MLRKTFKALELEFILSFLIFLELGINLMLNLFYYNYATNFVLVVDFRPTDNKYNNFYLFPVLPPFSPKGEINRR